MKIEKINLLRMDRGFAQGVSIMNDTNIEAIDSNANYSINRPFCLAFSLPIQAMVILAQQQNFCKFLHHQYRNPLVNRRAV